MTALDNLTLKKLAQQLLLVGAQTNCVEAARHPTSKSLVPLMGVRTAKVTAVSSKGDVKAMDVI